jgi:integrase
MLEERKGLNMAGVRSTPRCGKFIGWYTNMHGKQTFFAGMNAEGPARAQKANREETLRMALRFEDEHRQIRLGYRPAPKSADKHRATPIQEVIDQYIAWGKSQGGRNGYPWSETHTRKREAGLKWWRGALGLTVLADLDDALPRTEAALRKLQEAGKSGKTLAGYRENPMAFCDWAVKRGYLSDHPLKNSVGFDAAPKSRRRAMTLDEIAALRRVSPPERWLVYETALCSGLRAKELRKLLVDHLDIIGGGLRLDAAWTKNRKPGFQPLPPSLVQRLAESAEGKAKDAPLLSVPISHCARMLRLDTDAAEIPFSTLEGKLDFHSLRVTYTSFVIEAGATVKEAQSLARHSTPDLTMNVYAKTRPGRLHEVAAKVGRMIEDTPDYAHCRTRLAVGAELQSLNSLQSKDLRAEKEWWRRGELNPRPVALRRRLLRV